MLGNVASLLRCTSGSILCSVGFNCRACKSLTKKTLIQDNRVYLTLNFGRLFNVIAPFMVCSTYVFQ